MLGVIPNLVSMVVRPSLDYEELSIPAPPDPNRHG